ncbi:hypothetical protein SAMN05519104_7799 [Rhizobiales bacterium GAS188]|nr:hypothetical protein SAMN05519104_7799 [Rhizobiales bacterium GAS188]
MSGNEIATYAATLRGYLVGAGAGNAELSALTAAAQALADLADSLPGPPTAAAWQTAVDRWNAARDGFGPKLGAALLGPLAAVPGLSELTSDLGKLATEGIHGGADLGPIHLEVASATLVIQPPAFAGGAGPADAVAIGPFQVGEIAATMSSPFGGGKGLPGGGSIVRLPDAGFGGTLQVPLGAVQVSAAAALNMIGGQPAFLAVMGVQFVTPIQLSFGFSLDRVGGIIGINRRVDTDALRGAVRTGVAGDVLFAVKPPPNPLTLLTAADRLFPSSRGAYLIGPSLKLAWLSFGSEGSLIGLDVAVIVEIPAGKVAILGVAHAAIPGVPFVLNLRLDVLGIVDPTQQLVSIDASLVDSHVLGIFEVYGDAAMRLSWGTAGYLVVTVGGFYPGFNPEPAHLPALRRVGLSIDNPIPILEVRAEGYFAVTSNSIQFGGRWEIGISLGIEAHGFVQVDAIVQFRPFHFEARVAAGFDVSAGGFSFASVTLQGAIAGPGPITIHGALSIDVFLFSISWNETFTLGSGPSDALPTPQVLIDVIQAEMKKPENVHAQSLGDPLVVLVPRPNAGTLAAVPPTGSLQVAQRRAPLGFLIDRIDGKPLAAPQGVVAKTGSADVLERFSPGSYINLTNSEALSRPPFDLLPSGRGLTLADPPISASDIVDTRTVRQIVIRNGHMTDPEDGKTLDLASMVAITTAAGKPPALSNAAPLVTAKTETWTATGSAASFASATAAHQFVRRHAGVAQASADAAAPVDMTGV